MHSPSADCLDTSRGRAGQQGQQTDPAAGPGGQAGSPGHRHRLGPAGTRDIGSGMGSGIRLFAFMGRGWHQGLGPPCDLNHSPSPSLARLPLLRGLSDPLCPLGWVAGRWEAGHDIPSQEPTESVPRGTCPPTSPQRTLPLPVVGQELSPSFPQDPRRLEHLQNCTDPTDTPPQGLQQAGGPPRTGWYPAPACALLPALRPAPRSPKCCWISEWGGAWEGRWVDRWTEEGMDGWMDNG